MKPGFAISLGAHSALILYAFIGGVFTAPQEEALQVTEVTVLSEAEFAALAAPASAPVAPAQSPVDATMPPEVPSAETLPVAPEPPTPNEAALPDPTPDVSDLTQPVPEAEVTPETPPAPLQPDTPEGAAVTLAPDSVPMPRPAPRVAPQPAEPPEPEATPSETLTEANSPNAAPDTTPAEPQERTAPEEAATRIVPETTEPELGGPVAGLAPSGSPRPAPRPPRRATPPAQTQTTEVDAPAQSETGGVGSAPIGPPLTFGERDAFRLAVQQCWNLGALSTEALRTTVTVFVRMNQDGTPEIGSIRMIDFSGGARAAADQAFAAARRGIIRCGNSGYDLPPEKYAQWQEIELVFRPDGMRLR